MVDVRNIVAYDSNLIAVTSEKGSELLIIHAPVDGAFADLETVDMDDRQNGPRFLWVDVLGSVPGAENAKLTEV